MDNVVRLRIAHILVLVFLCSLTLLLGACSSTAADIEPPPQNWYVDAARFQQGAHAGLACADCHTDISLSDIPERHPAPDRITQDIVATFDYRVCQRCHPQEYAAYRRGIHADVLNGTLPNTTPYAAPTCGNCHSPHYDPPNLDRAQLISAQLETCGACHPVEQETYLQNIHGKAAANLGDTTSAACTDCHGAHDVVSLAEPQAALPVCQHCHSAATLNMAGFLIHARESITAPGTPFASDYTILFVAKVFFTLLIVGMLGFFYAHTLAWLIRSAHRRMRGH